MSMATTHENPMGNHGKPPKSGSTRRKISLPWFRQASIGEKLTRLRLPRQNTVDCPPSATRSSSSSERFSNIRRKVMPGSSSVEVDNLPYMCPISTVQFLAYLKYGSFSWKYQYTIWITMFVWKRHYVFYIFLWFSIKVLVLYPLQIWISKYLSILSINLRILNYTSKSVLKFEVLSSD